MHHPSVVSILKEEADDKLTSSPRKPSTKDHVWFPNWGDVQRVDAAKIRVHSSRDSERAYRLPNDIHPAPEAQRVGEAGDCAPTWRAACTSEATGSDRKSLRPARQIAIWPIASDARSWWGFACGINSYQEPCDVS